MPTKKKPNPVRVREVPTAPDTLRAEYDFRGGVRGKYAARYPHGSVVVTLAPDVAAAFPSSAAANKALRQLLREAGPTRPRRRGRRSASCWLGGSPAP